ncbi:helix-turn-helix domain-containing protein [Priestia megaterium]|uniref:helix-turn-helix domain-containing protein n=1 Tax=Priestia megaterium TaxID=1404 RepID=UPI00366C8FD5
MNINNFGRDIKALRTKKNIGSRELSRLIGKAETYISQLERGLIKKPDYNTAYDIMKHLKFTDDTIEDFLYNFYQIKSPQRMKFDEEEIENWEEKRAVEIEEMLCKKSQNTETNQDHQACKFEADRLNITSKWMIELIQKLDEKNEEIKRELTFNIEKNAQTFESVIENLHSLITSMRKNRENFNFFVGIFKDDLSVLSEESKEKILKAVKEEVRKLNQNKEQI